MSIIAAIFWGVVPIVLKYLVTVCRIETIIWFRFSVSFLFLVAYYCIADPQILRVIKKPPLPAIVAGLALAGNYFGHTTGVQLTSPSNAQIIIQLGPLLFAIAGVMFFKERLDNRQKYGAVLAIIGFLLFYWDQIANLLIALTVHLKGDLWIIFAAIVWAVFAAFQKMLVRRLTPQQANLLIYGVAALFFLPQAEFGDFVQLNPVDWVLLGFMGANTLIAYGALAVAIKLIPANHVAVIIVLNPLVTLAAMAALAAYQLDWLGVENISLVGYVGAGAMLAGVGLVVAYTKPN
jgi:drug/metabolite transporter (DMT)-like permease